MTVLNISAGVGMTQNKTYLSHHEKVQVITNPCEQLCAEGAGARYSVQLLARSLSKKLITPEFENKKFSMRWKVIWSWSLFGEIAALHGAFLQKNFAGGQ
jgi:hypothetical protein